MPVRHRRAVDRARLRRVRGRAPRRRARRRRGAKWRDDPSFVPEGGESLADARRAGARRPATTSPGGLSTAGRRRLPRLADQGGGGVGARHRHRDRLAVAPLPRLGLPHRHAPRPAPCCSRSTRSPTRRDPPPSGRARSRTTIRGRSVSDVGLSAPRSCGTAVGRVSTDLPQQRDASLRGRCGVGAVRERGVGWFDPGFERDHGTHVAGIIGAEANNGLHGRGVARDVEIYGVPNVGTVARNLSWAVTVFHADVVNMSFCEWSYEYETCAWFPNQNSSAAIATALSLSGTPGFSWSPLRATAGIPTPHFPATSAPSAPVSMSATRSLIRRTIQAC